VQHGAGDLLGEDVVDIDRRDTNLLVISPEDGDPEFPFVSVVGVKGDVQGDAHGEVVCCLHLVGVVHRSVVDLPFR